MKKYIRSGGSVISSANSGREENSTDFALSEEWGIRAAGPEKFNMEFFKTVKEFSKDVPDFPVTIYKPGISLDAAKGTEILAYLWEPYFNKHWDGYHGYFYVPPRQATKRPALTRKNNVFHFSFPVFDGYFEYAYAIYRNIVRNCLEKALPLPLVKTENIPPFARVTMTQKDNFKMLHILSYVPELRGKKQIIEEAIPINNGKIYLRHDGKIKNIYLAPSKDPLRFEECGDYIKLQVPDIKGYQMIVIEQN